MGKIMNPAFLATVFTMFFEFFGGFKKRVARVDAKSLACQMARIKHLKFTHVCVLNDFPGLIFYGNYWFYRDLSMHVRKSIVKFIMYVQVCI